MEEFKKVQNQNKQKKIVYSFFVFGFFFQFKQYMKTKIYDGAW